jgi:zinc protease
MTARLRPILTCVLVALLTVLALPDALAKPKRGVMPPVLVVERPWPPVVQVRVLLNTGALADPPGQEGLALLTWDSALRGAGELDRAHMAQALDALGAHLDVQVDKLGASLVGEVLLEHLDPFLDLLADTLLTPKLSDGDIEQVRAQLLADLTHLRDDDSALAHDAMGRYLYRGQALGRPTGGTEASLRAITPEMVREFHKHCVVAGNVRVGFAGPVDEATAKALVEKHIGLPPGTPPKVQLPHAVRDGRRLLLIDKPRHTQSEVVIAWPSVAAHHKDMTAIGIANAILGGTFTSRLNREIRELRGWSYNTWSALSSGPQLTTWALGFTPETADATPALELAMKILEELAQQGLTPQELRFAKDHLKGMHLASLETAERELAMRMRAHQLGMAPDAIDNYPQHVEAVDYKTIQRVLREHIRPEHLTAVVVGQARILDAKLRESAAQFEVEPLPADGQPEHTSARGRTVGKRPAPVEEVAPPPVDDDPSGSPDEDEPGEGNEDEDAAPPQDDGGAP